MKYESTARKNNFVEKYDYGRDIVGFGEYVLRIASSCPLGCSYCYLKDVNKKAVPKIYTNFELLKQEISELRNKETGKIRLNAGENSDSLVFEPQAGLIAALDDTLDNLPVIQVELRTKTANVDFLEYLRNKDKFTIVFTISPENIIRKYEKLTANLKERIHAAKKCQDYGFQVGLRFEPIINSKSLEDDYIKTIKLISENLETDKIQSVGMSCLRFTKGLMKKIEKSSPELLLDEFVQCPDGKYRYFRVIRTRIYRQLIDILKQYLPGVNAFLSSEPEYVWRDAAVTK